jgi:rubredoxin
MKAGTFMQSLLWCCTSCGFVHKGGQPFMECPICEAYKTAFVDIPQHIEAELIDEFGEDMTNSAEARDARLKMAREGGYLSNVRVKGRMTEAVHDAKDSRKYY